MIENLIKGGAFDCFNRTRADMLQWYTEEYTEVVESSKKHATGQISIFDMMPELKTTVRPNHTQVKEFPKQVLYNFENEVLGLYMTGSPLDEYDEISKKFGFNFTTEEIMEYVPDDSETGEKVLPVVEKRFVTTGGILHSIRVVIGNDNKKMGFGVLEDKFSSIEVAAYGSTYEKYKTLFAEDSFVVVKGNLAESRDSYKITLREIINPHSEKEQQSVEQQPIVGNVTLWLKMDERDDEKYAQVIEVLKQYEGDIPVKFKIYGKVYSIDRRVRRCAGVQYELSMLLGEKNIVFFEK